MSKTMEEMVVIGVIALLALKFLSSSAQASAQIQYQNSTAGQVASYASTAEGLLGAFTQDL